MVTTAKIWDWMWDVMVVLTKMVGLIRWIGVDIDAAAAAVEAARERIACAEMDFTAGIGFRDESFDAVMMTEVLELLYMNQFQFARNRLSVVAICSTQI